MEFALVSCQTSNDRCPTRVVRVSFIFVRMTTNVDLNVMCSFTVIDEILTSLEAPFFGGLLNTTSKHFMYLIYDNSNSFAVFFSGSHLIQCRKTMNLTILLFSLLLKLSLFCSRDKELKRSGGTHLIFSPG